MKRLGSVAGVLLILTLSMGFAALNSGQLITLRLGFTTLYGVSLSTTVFAALILGMVVMLLVGLRSDLRVRRILLERLADEDRDERARIFVDRNQTSLFDLVDPDPDASPPAAPSPIPSPTEPGDDDASNSFDPEDWRPA